MFYILSSENASQVNSILGKEPCVVFYYWNMCGYCKQIIPVWNKVCKKHLKSKVNIINVEMDQMPLLKPKYKKNISGVPTIIRYIKGKRMEEFNGDRMYKQLNDFVTKTDKIV